MQRICLIGLVLWFCGAANAQWASTALGANDASSETRLAVMESQQRRLGLRQLLRAEAQTPSVGGADVRRLTPSERAELRRQVMAERQRALTQAP